MTDQPENHEIEIKTNGTEIAMLLTVKEWHANRQRDTQTIVDNAEAGKTMNLGGIDYLLNTEDKARAFKIGVLVGAGLFSELPFTLTEIPNEEPSEMDEYIDQLEKDNE